MSIYKFFNNKNNAVEDVELIRYFKDDKNKILINEEFEATQKHLLEEVIDSYSNKVFREGDIVSATLKSIDGNLETKDNLELIVSGEGIFPEVFAVPSDIKVIGNIFNNPELLEPNMLDKINSRFDFIEHLDLRLKELRVESEKNYERDMSALLGTGENRKRNKPN